MADVRQLTHVFSFQPEDAFNEENGDFVADRLFVGVWGFDPATLTSEAIENQTNRSDLGENEYGNGLKWPTAKPAFNTYCAGVGGSGAGDGVTPTVNATTHLLSAYFGRAVVTSVGSVVKTGSSPTTTVVAEDDGGNHGANQFMVIADPTRSGRVVVRPITGYATDTMTLGFALTTAVKDALVAGTTVIYGAHNFTLDEFSNISLQGDILGSITPQNYNFRGFVPDLDIPEVANNETPYFSWKGNLADFDDHVVRTRTDTTSARPTPLAGGEFYLGMYGASTYRPLECLRFSYTSNRTLEASSQQNDAGIGSWVPTDQRAELTVYVKASEAVPPGFAGSTYQAQWRLGGTENLWKYMFSFSNYPGHGFAGYFPALRLKKYPEPANINNIACFKCTFAFAQGYAGVRKFWACQY